MIKNDEYLVNKSGMGDIGDDERLYREVLALHDIFQNRTASAEIMRYIINNDDYNKNPYTKRAISMFGGNPTSKKRKTDVGELLGILKDYDKNQEYLDNVIHSLFERLPLSSKLNIIATESISVPYRTFLYPSDRDENYILSGDVVDIYGRKYRRIPVEGDMAVRPLNVGIPNALKYMFNMGQIGREMENETPKYIYILEDQLFMNYLKNNEK